MVNANFESGHAQVGAPFFGDASLEKLIEAFIDIEKDNGPSTEEQEKEELEDFSLNGHDETGRNLALRAYD